MINGNIIQRCLHIVIDPEKFEYNDEIICEEMIVRQRPLGFVHSDDDIDNDED